MYIVEHPCSMLTKRETRLCQSEPGTYSMDCQWRFGKKYIYIYIYFLRIYRPKCHWWSTLYVTGSDWHNFVSFLVYIEAGRSTSTTTLTFTTASTSGITWKARVSQIECSRWVSSASFLVYFPYNLHLHFYVVNSPLALFATRMVALSYHSSCK